MNLKKGDKVTIRAWDDMVREFGVDSDGDIKTPVCFVKTMRKFCGEIVTVDSAKADTFTIKEDNSKYCFCEQTIKLTYKFKVGDKVIGNEKANGYGITRKGWVGTVMKVNPNNTFEAKDKHGCNFTHLSVDCFDLAKESVNQKIVITVDGSTTLARLYEGRKVIKSAEAKCSPDDTFDFQKGAEIAFNRLIDKPEKPEKRELYNGKVVCVDNRNNLGSYTTGKVYEFKNGLLIDNSGVKLPTSTEIYTFKDWQKFSNSKWLEIVE